MHVRTVRTLTCLVVAAVVVLFGTNVAQASPKARTRGDAQAVFQAGFTAGTNINVLHNSDANGTPKGILPTGDPQDVRIYPFTEEDASYCGSGWHVLNFNTGDNLQFYESRKQLVETLALVDIIYELDGTRVETQRTALKEENWGSDEEQWLWFSVGALLPPGTLTVGAHELTTSFVGPLFEFTFTVHFDVLPC